MLVGEVSAKVALGVAAALAARDRPDDLIGSEASKGLLVNPDERGRPASGDRRGLSKGLGEAALGDRPEIDRKHAQGSAPGGWAGASQATASASR